MSKPQGEPAAPEAAELTVGSASDLFAGLLSGSENLDVFGEDADESPPLQVEGEDDFRRPSTEKESEGDEDAADDEAEEEESEEPELYSLKVNGEDVQVTLDELLKGYSRTADYTRKTQELADQRRAAEADIQAVRDQRQQYAQNLDAVANALKTLTPEEPDWDKLQRENPDEFPAAWAAWQKHQRRVEAVAAEQQRVQLEAQRDQLQQYQEYRQREQEALLNAVPEWSDQEKRVADLTALSDFAVSLGFTPEEVANVDDHRTVLMLRMAHDAFRQQQEQQEKAPRVREKVRRIKAARPGGAGGSKSSAKSQRIEEKQARLAKTGTQRDAAALFSEFID